MADPGYDTGEPVIEREPGIAAPDSDATHLKECTNMDLLLRTLTAALLFFTTATAFGMEPQAVPKTRDPWRWPFSADSIWNKPIGSEAVYKPANLGAAKHVGTDIQILVRTSNDFPEREVLDSPTWGPGRATGTKSLEFKLRVPDDWTVPDAGKSNPYGLTPNANFAFLMPDGENVLQGCKVCRDKPSGPIYMPDWMKHPGNRKRVSLKSDGMEGGGQGASGMSALGGTIRLGELTGDQPIRHAIKINPFAEKYCFYSKENPGWRWPAKRADSYADKKYKGTNPALVMGTLLALKPDVTPGQLGLETAPGRKLFFALQNYGAYFTEDAAWDTWDLIVERDAEREFERAHGFSMSSKKWLGEVNKLMQALHIVDNNGPERIGGGGVPRQPLAPPFGAVEDSTMNVRAETSGATQQTADLFIGDMERPHDFRPQGTESDWSNHARRGMRKLPDGWTCATMWGQIYPAREGNPAGNVRVQIRNPRLWYLSRKDSQWHLAQTDLGVDGAAYVLDFAGDKNVKADLRHEGDGSISVRMTPGYNFHFWPTDKGPGRVTLKPDDVAAMASSFQARLIVDDPAKPDDRDQARLVGSCGGDFWRAQGVGWKADWSNNGDWAIGRFKSVTRNWQAFTGTNAEAAVLRQNPPPLEERVNGSPAPAK